MIGLTDLMEEQIKTTLVMAAAGVFTEIETVEEYGGQK